MVSFDIVESDPQELVRRRRLADAEYECERERKVLLVKLIRTEERAAQLGNRVRAHEPSTGTEPNPEFKRMLDWARAQLDALNVVTSSAEVLQVLRDRNLFLEIVLIEAPDIVGPALLKFLLSVESSVKKN